MTEFLLHVSARYFRRSMEGKKNPTLASLLATGGNQWLLPTLKFGLGYPCNHHLHLLLVKFPVSGTAYENTSETFVYSVYVCHRLQRALCCSLGTAQCFPPLALIPEAVDNSGRCYLRDCLPVHSPWHPWGSCSFADVIQGMSGKWSYRVFLMCMLPGLDSHNWSCSIAFFPWLDSLQANLGQSSSTAICTSDLKSDLCKHSAELSP